MNEMGLNPTHHHHSRVASTATVRISDSQQTPIADETPTLKSSLIDEMLRGLRERRSSVLESVMSRLARLTQLEQRQFIQDMSEDQLHSIVELTRNLTAIKAPSELIMQAVTYLSAVLMLEKRALSIAENTDKLLNLVKKSLILVDLCRCPLNNNKENRRPLLFLFYKLFDYPYKHSHLETVRETIFQFIDGSLALDQSHWLLVTISKYVGGKNIPKQYMQTLVQITMRVLSDDKVTMPVRFALRFTKELQEAFKGELVDLLYKEGYLERIKYFFPKIPGTIFNALDDFHGRDQNIFYKHELFFYLWEVVSTGDTKTNEKQISLCLRLLDARIVSIRQSQELAEQEQDNISELFEGGICDRLMELRQQTTDFEFIRTIYFAIAGLLRLCKQRYNPMVYSSIHSKFFEEYDLRSMAMADKDDIQTYEAAIPLVDLDDQSKQSKGEVKKRPRL